MEKTSTIIIDNFLAKEELAQLRNIITSLSFDWHFSPVITYNNPEGLEQSDPGIWVHKIYDENGPFASPLAPHLPSILEQLNPEFIPKHGASAVVHLARIRINLNCRLPEPYKYMYHCDMSLEDHVSAQWTASILYINTNNGYTEFENGEKIESVANRLVSFPANIRHRGVTQTDEQTRILINFNYLKMKDI